MYYTERLRNRAEQDLIAEYLTYYDRLIQNGQLDKVKKIILREIKKIINQLLGCTGNSCLQNCFDGVCDLFTGGKTKKNKKI